MTRHEIMLILEKYDVDPKTHNVIADKILALSGVVGQSEQLVCPKCNGTEVLTGKGDNTCAYTDCQYEWAD